MHHNNALTIFEKSTTSIPSLIGWVSFYTASVIILFLFVTFIIYLILRYKNARVFPADVIRPFGGFEYVFHDIVKVNGYHNLCLFAHFEHRFHAPTLKKALLLLQSQHALLHSTVVNEKGSIPVFKRMSWKERQNDAICEGTIATLRVLERDSPDQWQHVMEDEVNTGTASLRGILLLDPSPSEDEDDMNGECDVGLTVRHDIMDGKSIALLYVELIKLYRKLYIEETQHELLARNKPTAGYKKQGKSQFLDPLCAARLASASLSATSSSDSSGLIPTIPEMDDTVSLFVPEKPEPIPPSLDYYLLQKWPRMVLILLHFVWLVWMTWFFTIVPWCGGIPQTAMPAEVREERRQRIRELKAKELQLNEEKQEAPTQNDEQQVEKQVKQVEGLVDKAIEEKEILPSLWSTVMIHKELDPEKTGQLMQKCKEHGVTVGTALFTAAMRTSAEVIFKLRPDAKKTKIWGIMLVDLRGSIWAMQRKAQRVNHRFDPTSFGIYISSLDFIHTFINNNSDITPPIKRKGEYYARASKDESGEEFWNHSRHSKSGLTSSLAYGKHLTSAVAYTFLTKYAAFFSKRFANPMPCASFSLSNIGCFDTAPAMPSPLNSPRPERGEEGTNTNNNTPAGMQGMQGEKTTTTIDMPRAVNLLTENFPRMRDVHAGVTTGCSFPLPLISTFTYRGRMEVAFSFPRETMSRDCMKLFADGFMQRLETALPVAAP